MIAKFYNDYKIDLNGPTNILDNLYCSHKIDCYLFTPTEIKPRDTNPLLIKNGSNATAIEINETAVEIKQPLKIQSSTNSVFNHWLSVGILQPTTSTLGINCYTSASIGGNLTVLGSSNFTENVNIARSAPNGGEVAIGITNNGNSAYTSLYLQTRQQSGSSTNETGQMFVGAGSMVVQTRTNHPIILKSYADDQSITVPNSLTISNNSTRDVVIATPLIVNNNVTINGFLAAKPYISLKISTSIYSSGTILAVPSTASVIGTPGAVTQTNMGYQSATIGRGTVANSNYFLYTFTFPAHPLGSSFAVGCTFITGSTSNAAPNAIFTSTNTSTTITVWIREPSTNILRDGNFYVYSVP